jgi:hypothetical protein
LILDEWVDLCRGPFYQLEGNHEFRLSKFIWQHAPQINKLVRTIPDMLNLHKKLGLHWFGLSQWDACRIGDAILHHGIYFNKHVAVNGLDRYPAKFICGHTHRLQAAYSADRFHVTLGHGSDESLTAHNATPTGWTQSFGLLHEIRGVTSIETIVVKDGTCIIHGEYFNGKK